MTGTVSLFPQLFSATAVAILWLVIFLLTWTLHRQWWRIGGVRRALWVAPLVVLSTIGLWALAAYLRWELPESIFGYLSATFAVVTIALVIALPFSGLALTLERITLAVQRRLQRKSNRGDQLPKGETLLAIDRGSDSDKVNVNANVNVNVNANVNANDHLVDHGRRSVITIGAAAFPLIAVGAGVTGIFQSGGRVRMPEVTLTWKDLPPSLVGLRILHLSDIHLGYYHNLDDLEAIMLEAERHRPDLVLVTGDISDDLSMLPGALRIIDGLKAPLGTFASLGNHEYYRGIRDVLSAIDKGPIPLLRNSGQSVKVGSAAIHISGADDPAATHGVTTADFLRRTVDAALDGAPSNVFHILMSHRPKGFNEAAKQGIDLTLSGHTHGGIQIGFAGRSVLEPWYPEEYFWGHYRKGNSQLYTSGGVGHWFPFRLGCPPEAPIYILEPQGFSLG